MKAIIIFLITIFFFISNYKSSCHDNDYVHRRIVMEAYKLLKIQLGKEASGFADMDNYIGDLNSDHEDVDFDEWIDITTVTGGADGEDEADIIEFRDGPWMCNTSLNHFWLADYPNPTLTQRTIWLKYSGLVSRGWNFSAYTKEYLYIKGNFQKHMKIFKRINNMHYKYYFYEGMPLYKLYSSEELYLSYKKVYSKWLFGLSTKWTWEKKWINKGNEYCKRLFYNILGRTCHLLADMGVPEHIQASTHFHLYIDKYGSAPLEHWLEEHTHDIRFHWTAEKVYEERGGFVNPFCEQPYGIEPYHIDWIDHPVEYLMYTTAQIADYFTSRAECGNATYDHDIGEIASILQNDNLPGPKLESQYKFLNYEGGLDYEESTSHENIRDATFPYVIRATAGLLYWFLVEAKLIDPNQAYNAPDVKIQKDVYIYGN